MRDLFFKLFSMSFFDTGIQITPFSPAHIVYIALIFGGTAAAWLALRKKSVHTKEKFLRLLAYALAVSYLSDFFVHEFVYGGLNMDKLPFHICTVLCPLVAISQFNRKGGKIAEPVAMLATLSPMMYLCYPASVGSGEPWCYQAVQTMFYHGVLMAWGVLSMALGAVKPDIKRIWKSGLLLVCITLWAKLGNVLLEHNWFFLEEDALYIGLVGNGIIPSWVLMIVNPVVFFLAVLAVYGVVYALRACGKKKVAA
jgi:uncharacterized membrane protein YwaF